jgi:transcriptional accessory protein Tex/SPT6
VFVGVFQFLIDFSQFHIFSGVFSDRDMVMKGADFMVAKQLSHDPLLRKKFRGMYIQRALVCVLLVCMRVCVSDYCQSN